MRCFYALPLPAQARSEITAQTADVRLRYPGLKWVSADALHITVIFLGDLNQQEVTACIDIMKGLSAEVPAVDAVFDRVGTFPPKGRPRVFAAHLSESQGGPVGAVRTCRAIFDYLSGKLPEPLRAAAGNEPRLSRGTSGVRNLFVPHCTLARVREGGGYPELSDFAGLNVPAELSRCVLYKSVLGPKGPSYTELADVRFSAG